MSECKLYFIKVTNDQFDNICSTLDSTHGYYKPSSYVIKDEFLEVLSDITEITPEWLRGFLQYKFIKFGKVGEIEEKNWVLKELSNIIEEKNWEPFVFFIKSTQDQSGEIVEVLYNESIE